jgi:esterase
MSLALAASEYGKGRPLLVLHGLFGSGRNWAGIAQHLAATRQIIALDLRNHGGSPWAPTMSYREMADDVLAFIRARGFDSVDLLGHSMGGKVAMIAALAAPDQVERLIAVDVAPVAYKPTLDAYVRAMRAVDLTAVTRRGDVDPLLAEAVPNAAERGFLLQNLLFEDGKPRWRINLPVLEREMPDIAGFPDALPAAAYPGPALFVAGGASSYIRPEHEASIHRLFPRAEIVRIPNVGHWVHAEAAEAFLAIVEPFLAQAA